MLKGAFHQGFRRGMSVFFQKALIQAAAVDTDPDRDLLLFANIHYRLDPVFPADITGIDPDLGRAAFGCRNGQFVVKVDISHQWQFALLADLSEPTGCFHILHRQTRDLASGGL